MNHNFHIIPRKIARRIGIQRYFTGKPCKYGHICERYTSSGSCVECVHNNNTSDEARSYQKEYYKDNKEKRINYQKVYYRKNIDFKLAYHKKYREANIENIRQYREANKKYLNEYDRAYRKERRRTDPEYKLTIKMRRMLRRVIEVTNETKKSSTFKILGYTSSDLKSHIESQFLPGMTWDNTDEWHIDHIYPISRFIKEGIEDPKIINSLENLRPMWKIDNLSKGNLTFEEWADLYPERAKIYG